uniref:Uncharacterized protein n=1 Tax=Lepeophtheirus salmonis TaxID=72036 RepID=A0A0K2UUF1_LEPSM
MFVLWQKTCPILYRQIILPGLIFLPSQKHIKRLTSIVSMEAGISNSTSDYLNCKIASLDAKDRNFYHHRRCVFCSNS